MIGKTKLTEKQKETLRELANNICEMCEEHQAEVGKLQAHRITRGNVGGTYLPRNIKMLCRKCHKEIHYGEFK